MRNIFFFVLSLSLSGPVSAFADGPRCPRATAYFSPAPGTYRFIADDWNVYALDSWDPYRPEKREFRKLTTATRPEGDQSVIAFHPLTLDGSAYLAIGSDHRLFFLSGATGRWRLLSIPGKLQAALKKNDAKLTGIVAASIAYVFQDSKGNVYRCAPTQLQPPLQSSGQMPEFAAIDEIPAPGIGFSSFVLSDHKDGLFTLAVSPFPDQPSTLFRLSAARLEDDSVSYRWKRAFVYREGTVPRFSGMTVYPLDSGAYGVLGYQNDWVDPYSGRVTSTGIFFFTNAARRSFQMTGPSAELACTPRAPGKQVSQNR